MTGATTLRHRQHPDHERQDPGRRPPQDRAHRVEQEPSFKDSELDLALYLAATKTNHDLEAALKRMQSYDPP